MTSKEIIDLVVAIGTLLAAIFAGGSALFAAKSARDAARAINMQREAVRAQTFVNIINYEREINFSQGMDTVRGLRDEECKNYTEFRKKQPEKDKEIRQVVDFLNHLAHLIRQEYVEPRHILPLYTTSITDCRAKLLGNGKWLDGFRKVAGSETYYLNFQCLCDNLVNLWSRNEIKWPDFWPPSEAMRS